ncbi:unnamed protein product [Kuraishia capsulata CBS 1993]|uniref:Uncharacterized protein n=1 Tax=Kuraishia capsulata CBS 1993 TaxID=1382522 RepID=W6MHP1_9ASCO|nr:uncharacterized protein KUCA_T00001794001 [Kuraishia capsulata CBS 1993]CDK25824.1 unnamed protein product [Kuraishia capsulata CBS 1993]
MPPQKKQIPDEYVKFYEHEHNLGKQQRLQLADVFYRITVSQSLIGIAGLALGGSIPLILLRINGRKATKMTALHQTLGGMVGGFVLPQFCGPMLFRRQLARLEAQDVEVRKTFELTPYPTMMAFMWRNYFANDRKLPDPNDVQKALNTARTENRSGVFVDSEAISPAWDKVRKSQGRAHATEQEDRNEDDIFGFDEPEQEGIKDVDTDESSWERIRKQQSVSYRPPKD